jgi:predicted GNAT superfamily acetyltransferase
MTRKEIHIAPITSLEGFHGCERLQQAVWGFTDMAVVPHHLLITARAHGGLLLGAYTEGKADTEHLIGFLFSFPGLQYLSGRWQSKHCSLMAAVLPEYRFRGIGYQLKLQQREFVLSQGLELITWTFDPLVSANAYFNFAKLGVIARRYEVDYYGDMGDELNRDLPTDRFTVEWWIRSPRVITKLKQTGTSGLGQFDRLPRINKTTLQSGVVINESIDLDLDETALLVEIPGDLGAMKERDLALAQRWRTETRAICEHYLKQGYLISEFFADSSNREHPRRGYYLLERVSVEELLGREVNA